MYFVQTLIVAAFVLYLVVTHTSMYTYTRTDAPLPSPLIPSHPHQRGHLLPEWRATRDPHQRLHLGHVAIGLHTGRPVTLWRHPPP